MKNVISVTQKAFNQLQKINTDKYITFFIEGGGCNGFKYCLKPTNEIPKKNDELFIKDNLQINICGKSLLYVLGTEIDWKEDYMGSRFEFNNPNATSKCGCGSTFSL